MRGLWAWIKRGRRRSTTLFAWLAELDKEQRLTIWLDNGAWVSGIAGRRQGHAGGSLVEFRPGRAGTALRLEDATLTRNGGLGQRTPEVLVPLQNIELIAVNLSQPGQSEAERSVTRGS